MANEVDLKLKIQAQNTATPALTELLNSIKSLIEQARILNTLLHFNLSATNNSGNLGAELHSLEQQAQQLQNHLNLRINAQNNAGGALNSAAQSAQNFGNAAQGAAGGVRTLEEHAEVLHTRLNQFIALQVAQVVTVWGKSLVHTAEAYQTNAAKLHLAVKGTEEFNAVHQELFDIAQRSRGSLDQTTNAFIRNSESIKRMGGTTEQALLATELLNKAIASTSMGMAQDASALMQWNQALGKGILNGDELNSIMENSLGLTKAIADGMGIPIGKLKELGEQGKLTGTDLVNALFANRQAIEANFNAIPITISQAFTAAENEIQQYIGKANETSGATQGIAKAILEVSKGLPEIVNGLTSLAGIYGVKLTSSLVAYIAQLRIQSAANVEAVAETERLNYVRIQELEIQRAVAVASVTAARSKLAEARLDVALATSVADRATANEALALSIAQVTAAQERYIGVTAALGAATDTATVSMTRMEVVAQGLKSAFGVLFAAWAGWEVGTFLRKFESVRDAGSLFVEGFVIQMETAKYFFSGDFLTGEQGLAEKIKAIHKDFADSRVADSEDAQQAAEQSKARSEAELERVKLEKIVKQETFKEIQAELKETGAAMDAETARQTAATKIALEQQKADIAASTLPVLEKELLIAQAVKASQDAQLIIVKQAAQEKLAVVDKVYADELQKLTEGSVDQKAVQKESLTARLGIYQELEKSYSGMIGVMIAEEQRLANDSLKLAEQRKGIEQSYEDFKTGLLISSKKGWEKDVAERGQLDKLVSDQKKALAAGDIKSAEEYDARILELGKKLATAQQESINAGKGFQGQYDDIIKITDKAQAGLLAANQKAQDANKQRLGELSASADEAKSALGSVQSVIESLNKELQAKHSLKIDPDTAAIDAAIARIKQPTSSTHTINVVETRTQAHATGGMIYHYANGGFTKKQGAISGKGTGTSDEIPAMLSNGEYVIKADKVAQYGKGTFDAINYGSNPVAIAHYAGGGLVGDDKVKQKVDELKKQAYEQAVAVFDDPRNQVIWRMSGSTSGSSDPNGQERRFETHIGEYLKANGLPLEWRDMYLSGVKASQVITTKAASFEEKARASLAIEDISASFSSSTPAQPVEQAPTPAKPTSVIPPTIAPPSLPSITPANFSPMVSRSSSTPTPAGKVSTVKFVSPDGSKSVTGQSQDPNFASFFDELNTVSGVTKQ